MLAVNDVAAAREGARELAEIGEVYDVAALHERQVGEHAGRAAIAISERVNGHEPMMRIRQQGQRRLHPRRDRPGQQRVEQEQFDDAQRQEIQRMRASMRHRS